MLPDATVRLGDDTEVAGGNSRVVHAHPRYPDQLIKLPRAHPPQRWTLRALRRRLRPSGAYKSFLVELLEYRRLARNFPQGQMPIPAIHGFVRTTLGAGLLVDAVRPETGQGLAPTLADLLAADADRGRLVGLLDELLNGLRQLRPSIGDLHPGNIVCGRYGGMVGLFIVDGLGRSLVFPVDVWFQPMNRARLDAAHADLLKTIMSVGVEP